MLLVISKVFSESVKFLGLYTLLKYDEISLNYGQLDPGLVSWL